MPHLTGTAAPVRGRCPCTGTRTLPGYWDGIVSPVGTGVSE
ncbi:hypothetical protein ACF1BE_11550 [Streptomyces sp. NPDC014991]